MGAAVGGKARNMLRAVYLNTAYELPKRRDMLICGELIILRSEGAEQCDELP